MLAGTGSGVGKTTLTVGLIAALRRRGFAVQPFKVGPDYIDPSYHTRAAGGVTSRNLDLWLVPAPALRALFQRALRGAQIGVVEGVMGLFDGRLGQDGFASSAHVARELGIPVVLVLDVGKTSRSAGALALGYRTFDPFVHVVGVVLNRVGSAAHAAEATAAIEQRAGLPVLGAIRKDALLGVPERYLGLIPTTEGSVADAYFEAAEQAVSQGVDLDRLMRLIDAPELAPRQDDQEDPFPSSAEPARARIAVARDRAFSFYYQDNLDLLEAYGAEIVPFSPLEDASLPEGATAVYIGGGFPELFASELSANTALHAALKTAQARGLPIYAECGGLMFLGQSLEAADGQRYAQAGLIPLSSTLANARLSVGYREARARWESLLMRSGEQVRAHEFHWSRLETPVQEGTAAYAVGAADARGARPPALEGYAQGSLLASYLHLHFAGLPQGELAQRFVERAAQARSLLPVYP